MTDIDWYFYIFINLNFFFKAQETTIKEKMIIKNYVFIHEWQTWVTADEATLWQYK